MLPSGIFFTSYTEEAALLRTRPQRLWFVAFLVALFAAPAFVGPHTLGVATMMLITLVAVFGLQVTTGMAGQFNLGQSAFVGVGAFVAAKLAALDLPLIVVIPAAGIAAGASSVLFGLPAVRVKGFYLALTTLAAQVMFPILVIRLPTAWFGGANGLPVDPPTIAGLRFASPERMYIFCLVPALIMGLLAFNLRRSRIGRAFRAVRDNDIAAAVLGIAPLQTKVLAFFAGALFAGVAGALYAYDIRYVTVEQFSLWQSVWYVGMLLVGGLPTPLGAVLGVVAITVLQETLRELGGILLDADIGLQGGFVFASTNVLLGGIILLALIREPDGLAHRWGLLKTAYRIWPYPRR
jgi:branched-chain amino acid transport system permease protein